MCKFYILYELFSTLTISSVSLNGVNVPFVRTNSAVKIGVNYPAGTVFTVRTNYNGTPPTAQTNPLGGSGMSNATSPSWGNEVVWSLSEPFCAYEWWPCKQSLTDKADSCDINITVPNACKAGSNGKLMQVVNLGNGTSRYEWKHRHPIDYYLISVAVAEYVEYNVLANPVGAPAPILIQNYIYNNPQTLPNFQADIDETADFIELFYGLYGPYPCENEKYGHCMAPFSGGMEHQTMTTQGFFNPTLTAHELGHQWFGDKVTCATWQDLWLNEGFATYLTAVSFEYLRPKSEWLQRLRGMRGDVTGKDDGCIFPRDTLNVGSLFNGRLTYNKGAWVLHMLRDKIGDSAFFKGCRIYLTGTGRSYGFGTTTSLEQCMEQASGRNLDTFFKQWYFGEGFPYLKINWKQKGDLLTVQCDQTPSHSSVPFWHIKVPVLVRGEGRDSLIIWEPKTLSESIKIRMPFQVDTMIFDPNVRVLAKASVGGMNLNKVQQKAFVIFPNPAQNVFQIFARNPSIIDFELYNALGQKMMTGGTSGRATSVFTVSLENMSSGPYFLRINDGNFVYSHKLIKQ